MGETNNGAMAATDRLPARKLPRRQPEGEIA
jgi:hypothetical protein